MNKKKLLIDTLLVVIGNIILAFGIQAFLVPSGMISGGATGIALFLTKFIPLQLSQILLVINVILFIIGFVFLGKKFALGTLLSTILFPFFLGIFESIPEISQLTDDMLLYVIGSGVFMGIGCGIVLRMGYSTGGTDVIPVLLNKKTGTSIGFWMNATDTVILLGQIMFSTPEEVLYGIVVVALTSIVIDKTMLIGESKLQVIIISKYYEEIATMIDRDIERGCTFLKITTGYMRQDQKAVLTVVSKRQAVKLNDLIHTVDQEAFIITSEVHSVRGRGFTLPNVHIPVE